MLILVVDDEDPVRTLLVDILADAGHITLSAINGREAIACLRRHKTRIQLVLLDVMMPSVNGWDVLKELQRDPTLAAIPVVMMTAGGNVRQKAQERGASGYLPKPTDLDMLLEMIERYEPQHASTARQKFLGSSHAKDLKELRN
jgi:two-component system, chemotaxis family, chemotaxis protein CheY